MRIQRVKTTTINLPAYWATALINADISGLSDQDIQELNTWEEKNKNLGYCAGCSEESFFGQFNGLGTDLLEYTFVKP